MILRSAAELALLVIKQRKKLKLSQSMVAKKIGVKQQTISSFENKPERSKLQTLFYILSAVNLDLSALDKSSDQTEWKEEW
ncbi:MAG: transcriptional regulator [Gammaproteobacteria bacterium RIFCSPHIGHO2_12_FULL_38_11]|nr:MAG: transcriptional regulator [Gammaproteobacteria bacterium RIFCSPHIGHO2_12_FULL_38_11]